MLPDEIYINPRTGKEVEFGQTIIASLSGESMTYIKTDRLGDMTHWIDSSEQHVYPLVDHKCYASGFIAPGEDVNILDVDSAFDSNQTGSVKLNNIDSYGDLLYTPTLLTTTTTLNPPSATIEGDFLNGLMEFVEFEMRFTESVNLRYIDYEFDPGTLTNWVAQVYVDVSGSWQRVQTIGGVVEESTLVPNNPVNQKITIENGVDTTIIRVRLTALEGGSSSIKILHTIPFGVQS